MGDYYVRFSSFHIWLHNTLAVSFLLLAYTGFALRYSDAWWAIPILKLPAGADIRGWVHRFFGVLLTLNFLLQIFLLFFTSEGREERKALMLSKKDFRDFLLNLACWFGIVPHPPQFGRYSYVEKVEYWALVWGTVVMAVTGFLMWSETWALRHFPGWVYDLARLIHFYEAVLASLAIAVWHFYWVIFEPSVYPFSEAMFTGKVPLNWLQHHHPLEYQEALERLTREKISTISEEETFGE
ncbi:MAG: formate dehydrogenase subunit gamma [bacterium JZ-2024 1]